VNGSLTNGGFFGVDFKSVDKLGSFGAVSGTDNGVFGAFLSGETRVVSGCFAVDVADNGGFFDNEGSGGGAEGGGLDAVLVGAFVLLFSISDDEHEFASFIVVQEAAVHSALAHVRGVHVNHASDHGSLIRFSTSSRTFHSK